MRKNWILFFLLILIFSNFAESSQGNPIMLSSRARISVITADPGNALYSQFGHSAIRVYDPLRKLDIIADWGTMPFQNTAFFKNFLLGKLDYMLDVSEFERKAYIYKNYLLRGFREQILNLHQEDVQEIYNIITENALPENRIYDYQFFIDNCSTRVLDVLEMALGDKLVLNSEGYTAVSFREAIAPYLEAEPHLYYGISWILGSDSDRLASYDELSFLPYSLFDILDAATIKDNSSEYKFVSASTRLFESTIELYMVPIYLNTGLGLWVLAFLALFSLLLRQKSFSKLSRRIDISIFIILTLIGLILFFFNFISGHHEAKFNWDAVILFPTHIIFFILYLQKRKRNIASNYFFVVNIINTIIMLFYAIASPYGSFAIFPLYLILLLETVDRSRLGNFILLPKRDA